MTCDICENEAETKRAGFAFHAFTLILNLCDECIAEASSGRIDVLLRDKATGALTIQKHGLHIEEAHE